MKNLKFCPNFQLTIKQKWFIQNWIINENIKKFHTKYHQNLNFEGKVKKSNNK